MTDINDATLAAVESADERIDTAANMLNRVQTLIQKCDKRAAYGEANEFDKAFVEWARERADHLVVALEEFAIEAENKMP